MRASYYVTFSMVGLGAMAVFLLGIGLRGFLTKRPFLFSAKWLLLIMGAFCKIHRKREFLG